MISSSERLERPHERLSRTPHVRSGRAVAMSSSQLRPLSNGRRVFLIPLVLAVLSVFGLLSALIGDAIWDVLSWLALATPILAIGSCLIRSRLSP
jgi:hypothetical protein